MKILFFTAMMSFLVVILFACSQKKEFPKSVVRIGFDQESIDKIMQRRALRGDKFTQDYPSDISSFNCWGIFITYPEKDPINSCVDSLNSQIARPDKLVGTVLFPSGVIETEVEAGAGRIFQVVAFDATSSYAGACPSFNQDFESVKEYFSHPFILGQVSQDIVPGSTSVTLPAGYNAASTPRISDCNGPLFNFGTVMQHPCVTYPNCLLWVDTLRMAQMFTNDVCSLAAADGDPMGCWLDNRGNGQFLMQSTIGNRPTITPGLLMGRPGITFGGSTQYLTPSVSLLPGSTGTIFVVFSLSAAGSATILGGKSMTGSELILSIDGSNFLAGRYGNTTVTASGPALTVGTPYIATMSYDVTGNVDIWLNGDPATYQTAIISGNGGTSGIYLGVTNNSGTPLSPYLNGRIFEVVMFGYKMPDSELQQTVTFLKNSWGIL